MANAIKQFRFYGNGNTEKNQPKNATADDYQTGNVFSQYYPMVQLGIQALPGTMFYLNNAADPIRVGRTGFYELELESAAEIYHLRFDQNSLAIINNNSTQAYLIVDIVYNDREA